jgi:hypothetical protein
MIGKPPAPPVESLNFKPNRLKNAVNRFNNPAMMSDALVSESNNPWRKGMKSETFAKYTTN